MSLLDWLALTSSLGCTRRPRRSEAREASTSFMFMLVDVPEPVWKTSTGNWSAQAPSATSSAAAATAPATSASTTPRRPLTRAEAALRRARARISRASRRRPDTGKFSTARWV
jgi:hypothetical protein